MRRIVWIIVLILWVLLALWICWKFFCGFGGVAAVPAPVKDKCDVEWSINDGNNFKSSSPEYIGFKKSSYQRLNASNELKSQMQNVASYLKRNKERGVTVTGYYDTDERNQSVLPNLGLARANNVRSWLSQLGVPATQIETKANTNTQCWTGNRDTLRHGISMSIGKLAEGNDRRAKIKDRLFGKPVTVYFDTNADNLNLNAQQRTDFADLFYYLERVDGAKLSVGGHTDNIGNLNSNVKLSQERAEFVKNYLVTKGGVPEDKIDVKGFGPNKPVQTNSTPDGRKLNRRVEVILK